MFWGSVTVLAQVDFGHTSPNLPLPVGVRAHVDADNRTLSQVRRAAPVVFRFSERPACHARCSGLPDRPDRRRVFE
ncbi:hypothetical protein AB0B15_23720 [Streptomyces sp. NPDC045456]|uniref:hypothetical protein n=1 Tax=unclassified Streptomyces TaxID=2593676 RepID=UPI00340182F0